MRRSHTTTGGAQAAGSSYGLRFEQLQDRLQLTVGFVSHNLATDDFWDVAVADINRDGWNDLVTLGADAREGIVELFTSKEGAIQSEARTQIANMGDYSSFQLQDLDGDTDLDILFITAGRQPKWLENEQGDGTSWTQHEVNCCSAEAISWNDTGLHHANDVDGDGDIDVMVSEGRNLHILENDGIGGFRPDTQPNFFNDPPSNIIAVDVIGDTTKDLVVGFGEAAYVVYEAVEGDYRVSSEFQMDRRLTRLSQGRDLDGDGDQDLVADFSGVGWLRNEEGQFSSKLVSLSPTPGIAEVTTADLDADGDFDLISTSVSIAVGGAVEWHENVDGAGTLSSSRRISLASSEPYFTSAYVADIDGDGDLDVAAAAFAGGGLQKPGLLAWYENRLNGDVDDNGEVGFSDFLEFSRNFGKEADAIWEDGDFNTDGAVNFEDFLLLSGNFGVDRHG